MVSNCSWVCTQLNTHCTTLVTVKIIWCARQVVGGVPCNWWCGDLLAVPNSASDTICVRLGLLCGPVWSGIQPFHPILRGGGSAGDPHPPAALLQESVELSGCSDCRGVCPSRIWDYWSHFFSFLQWLSFSLLLPQLSVVAIIMNITRTAMVGSLLKGLLENHTSHPSFESLANLQVQFNNVAAVIVFFSWVKVKKNLFPFDSRSVRHRHSGC